MSPHNHKRLNNRSNLMTSMIITQFTGEKHTTVELPNNVTSWDRKKAPF